MSRRIVGGRWTRGLGLAVVSLALGGCPAPNQSETETPSGPSERNEIGLAEMPIAGAVANDAEAEQAAKVAAAQKVLQKVNDRDPEEEKKKMARSRAISGEARTKLNKRAHDDAVKTARQALKVHEQNVDAMLVIAEVYYREGKYELTRAVTSSALQVDAKIRTPEDSSRAYNLQGFAMLAMDEENAATQSFKKAAEADDKNAAAWNNMGTRYLDAGDVATATACFQYALELDPRFFKAHLNYGASLRAEHKWEDAEKALRKALELRPGYAEAYFNLGVLYLDADPFPGLDTSQRLNKAIQHLAKYRELAKGSDSKKPGSRPQGVGVEGSAKAPPPRVSKERADGYIRVANKGLEREARRLEREKGRQAAPGDESTEPTGEPTTAEPAVASDAGTNAGAEQPTPQGPGAESPEPAKPTPQGPGVESPESPEPAKPTPQGPGTQSPAPAKPTPQGPGTAEPAPSKPAPSKPAPSKPAPSKPAPQGPSTQAPAKPAPQGPSPQKPPAAKPAPQPPPPAKPAPQGPSPQKPPAAKPAPQGPSAQPLPPQKPSVQKPQSASWGGARPSLKKVHSNPASRGTRSSPSTLIPMEAGAPPSSCANLVLTPVDAAPFVGIDPAHGHRLHARFEADALDVWPPSPNWMTFA